MSTSGSKKSLGSAKMELLNDQKLEIRDAFMLFDADDDGQIDYHECKVALRALGFDMSKREVLDLIRLYDTEDKGLIKYRDFYDAGMWAID